MSRDELTNTAWLYLLLKCHNICTCCIVISRYEEEAIPIEVLQVCNNSVTDITCRDENANRLAILSTEQAVIMGTCTRVHQN